MREWMVASGSAGLIQLASRRRKRRFTLLLMASPFIALVLMFSYLPLFGWVYAFFDYKPGIPLSETPYVGLKFFRMAVTADRAELLQVLRNTLMMSVLNILTTPLSLVFAILFNEARGKWFKKFVQTTTTLPYFISWIIVFSLFFSIFSADGVFNQILFKLHVISKPTQALGNHDAAWYIQAGIALWKNLGWGAIVYLAAIAGIDPELYDAAKVDGAGRFRTIRHITLPGVIPTFLVLLLLSVSNMLSNGFDQFFIFYNPLVADKLEVLDYYVYRIGIINSDYSYATAIGVAKTLISIVLLFGINMLSKRLRGHSIV